MQPSQRSPKVTHIKRTGSLMLSMLLLVIIQLVGVGARAQIPVDLQPESSEKKEGERAKSVVRGRVLYEDTNRPVRRVRVVLLDLEGKGGMEKNSVTDERGEFRIKEVPAGNYIVMVDAPGIITPISLIDMDENVDRATTLIQIKKESEQVSVNGTDNAEVQVRARRGGVITGKVTYADGDPAINAQITILRKRDGRLARFILGLSPSGILFRTDDRGVYRIAGLPPGEYVVGASEANLSDETRDGLAWTMDTFANSNLSVSYYQNETNLRQATAVKVEAGQEVNEVNVSLIDRARHNLSGTVMARQGRTPVRARINILAKSDSVVPFYNTGPGTQSDAEGRWAFSNVPDGTYILTVEPVLFADNEEEMDEEDEGQARPTSSARPKQPSLVRKQQEVTVSGGDLSGVLIELGEGGRVAGTIFMEGSKEIPQNVGILLSTPDGKPLLEKFTYAAGTGAFELDSVPPGEFYLSITPPATNFYVKSIMAGGVDLLRESIKVGPGTNINNIRITLSSEMATLTGRVVSASDQKPVRGATVLLVPSDPARWRFSGIYLFGTADANGSFTIMGAPGTYLLIPISNADLMRGVNEAFIRARAADARQVTLQGGGRETVELTAPAQP